ncbi:hypothetical protein SCB71_21360 (plasmid) [Herbiconiux sp. KACC 21604]|uniref:hypothetical protein n=1 Tax=unclassified Herbiconiux TaxID=2618217 RepID=UPI001492E237|nr:MULTISPECIES: hypothetical protein [unclassified Herbiconiux]QJU56293.1 hypothetical protein HL652_21160 [Herbiconiux sp. SALV-R1]WPO88798.1 hypothetical protein SCB71_21360 [Herbiconiux sp. KACC 21604]
MSTDLHSDTARHIGGESAHRSFFGGTVSRTRIIGLGAAFFAMLLLTPLFGIWGLTIGLVGGLTVFFLTQRTHRGSILDRRTKRVRWRSRVKTGTDAFEPFDVAEWDQREQAAAHAKGRAEKRATARALTAMRGNPDGADGMGWLQCGPNEPGIAWHAPLGEQPYLSVTFSATGQVSGSESSAKLRRAAEAFGMFLASRATPMNLVGDVQMTTRVLPADSAMQEFWVLSALDPDAPAEAVASYETVLRLNSEDAMVQRHYFTISWPLTPAFHDTAAKYGAGRDGWRLLMRQEIASALRGLTEARVGQVEALTARRLTAVLLHQQNPSRPIDHVKGVDPARVGIRSHDEYSAHVVDDADPVMGNPVQWWHRTAAIRSENMAMGARRQLWALDLLTGSDIRFIRTLSFHLHLVPKGEAKAATAKDVTRDNADTLDDVQKGRVQNDETAANLSAAKVRARDLAHGSAHHGGTWIGYVTITERDRDALMRASRALEETCATGLGIERLEWQDSYQAAASGTTWPIGRGLTPGRVSVGSRFMNALAGKTEREAL